MSPLYRVRFSPFREDDPSYKFGELLEIYVTDHEGTVHRGIDAALIVWITIAVMVAHASLNWSGIEIASVEYVGRAVGVASEREKG